MAEGLTSEPPASIPRPRTSQADTTPTPPTVVGDLDELDHLVNQASKALRESPDWVTFFQSQRDARGDLGDVSTLNHPARHLLTHYKKRGVPVTMQTKDWSKGQKLAALGRGPHKSASEFVPFLRGEYCDMIRKGHWVLLPAEDVIDIPELRLSPLGVVPQRERRPRTISDYSFFGVNADTVPLAPKEAMQFGKALPRILRQILDANPKFGPVYLSKIDIADGFYRLGLQPKDALRLGVIFPSRPGERQLIGIPLVLPMGWSESPPAFCAATETVADLANHTIAYNWAALAEAHRLDAITESTPEEAPVNVDTSASAVTVCTGGGSAPLGNAPHPSSPAVPATRQKPLQSWDVYVDDFLGLAQGNRTLRRKVKRALLQALDKVFRPLDEHDRPERQEPASLKKLKKGDGTWTTRKVLLGWDLDTVAKTLALPPHRKARLHEILASIKPAQKTVPTKQWHKVLGELRSMAIAIPGSRGLFSLLQEAFRHEEKQRPRLRLTKQVHAVLDDFRWLARDIANRPTRLAELVPTAPAVLGACDAAGSGMGGVFFVSDDDGVEKAMLWRHPFPNHIRRQLVTFDNPDGTINNSDLELCGNIAHHDVIAQVGDIRERTIHTLSDNVASVFWLRKGSTTTTGPPAYLLRAQALHQRFHRYVPRHDYIPGEANAMADKCSRAWELTDSQLLAFFDRVYPQTQPWRMCSLRSNMTSALTSALLTMPFSTPLAQHMPSERMRIGSSGSTSASTSGWIHSYPTFQIRSDSSKFSLNGIATGELPPASDKSQLSTFQTYVAPLHRRSCGWGPLTHDSPGTDPSISACDSSSRDGLNPIHPLLESSLHR